jgi:hypothetical protein
MPTNLNTQVENEYRLLFDTCIISEKKLPEIDEVISKMVKSKASYDAVANTTNIPWNFIAIIHCMEGSLSFKKHLHNGDSLTARTVQIPKGRPTAGKPPFTWEESALMHLQWKALPLKLIGAFQECCLHLKNIMKWDIVKEEFTHLIYGVFPTISRGENLLLTVCLITMQFQSKWEQQFY